MGCFSKTSPYREDSPHLTIAQSATRDPVTAMQQFNWTYSWLGWLIWRIGCSYLKTILVMRAPPRNFASREMRSSEQNSLMTPLHMTLNWSNRPCHLELGNKLQTSSMSTIGIECFIQRCPITQHNLKLLLESQSSKYSWQFFFLCRSEDCGDLSTRLEIKCKECSAKRLLVSPKWVDNTWKWLQGSVFERLICKDLDK
jgi:hypothetical protein